MEPVTALRAANAVLSFVCVAAFAVAVSYRWPRLERHDKWNRLSVGGLLLAIAWGSILFVVDLSPVLAVGSVTVALLALLGSLLNMARCEVRQRMRQ